METNISNKFVIIYNFSLVHRPKIALQICARPQNPGAQPFASSLLNSPTHGGVCAVYLFCAYRVLCAICAVHTPPCVHTHYTTHIYYNKYYFCMAWGHVLCVTMTRYLLAEGLEDGRTKNPSSSSRKTQSRARSNNVRTGQRPDVERSHEIERRRSTRHWRPNQNSAFYYTRNLDKNAATVHDNCTIAQQHWSHNY